MVPRVGYFIVFSRPALWRHRFSHVDCAMTCGDIKNFPPKLGFAAAAIALRINAACPPTVS
jgi:hypothetical protein